MTQILFLPSFRSVELTKEAANLSKGLQPSLNYLSSDKENVFLKMPGFRRPFEMLVISSHIRKLVETLIVEK